MIEISNISKSEFLPLPFLTDTTYRQSVGKGWSWSYVYNLVEIRNVFIALKQLNGKGFELNNFFSYCKKIRLPYDRTVWTKRRILEHVNALINFGIIDSDSRIIKNVFIDSEISTSLNKEEYNVFRTIYFQYFQFKEIFSWFIKQPSEKVNQGFITSLNEKKITEQSHPIYCFSHVSRFTDSFILGLNTNPKVYYIKQQNEDLMRFWDVFIKWGTTLQVLEKFSLRNLNIKTLWGRNISCTYVINERNPTFNLVTFLNENYKSNYIYIPQLVLDIVMRYRFSVKVIHNLIIEQYKQNKDILSFERTSEIFIKQKEIRENEKILFPKYQDAYISYLILRK